MGKPKHNDETGKELDAIHNMIERANKHHLLAEAIWSFAAAVRANNSIEEAAYYALSEWDL